MGVQQYSVDFDAKAYEHKGRGQSDSAEVINFFIEYVRVARAAAAHQYKAQCDKGDTDEHEHVVLLLKNELLFRLLIYFCRVSLCHGVKVVKS